MWEKLGFSRETELEGARVGGENETEQGEVPDPADEISGNNNGHGYTATAMNDDMENRRESVNSSIVENISICGDCGCLKAIMGASNKESSQHEQIEQTDTSDTAPITMPRKEPPMAGKMLLRVNGIFVVMIAGCQTFAGLQTYLFKDNADGSFHFVGAFWVGLFLLLPGTLGIMSTSYTIVLFGFLTGLIGLIVALLGIVSDGSAYTTYLEIKACSHSSNTTVTDGEIGTYSLAGDANGCFSNNNQYQCSCIDTSYDCYVFDGGSYNDDMESNCNAVIEDYPDYLASSYGICIVCVAVIFVYIVLSGSSLFCPAYLEKGYVWQVEMEEPKIEEKQEEMIKEVTMFYESPNARAAARRSTSVE